MRPDDLAALVVAEVVDRCGVDPAVVDKVISGAANQAGETVDLALVRRRLRSVTY